MNFWLSPRPSAIAPHFLGGPSFGPCSGKLLDHKTTCFCLWLPSSHSLPPSQARAVEPTDEHFLQVPDPHRFSQVTNGQPCNRLGCDQQYREGRRSASPSIYFCNTFSPSSSASTPWPPSMQFFGNICGRLSFARSDEVKANLATSIEHREPC